MPLRLGYAGINLSLQAEQGGARLRSITAKRLATLEPRERRAHLYQVGRNNLKTLRAVLRWNHSRGIFVFRITSDLIPLATHPIAAEWNWEEDLASDFAEAAGLIRRFGAQVTMHPGQYTVRRYPCIKDLSLRPEAPSCY